MAVNNLEQEPQAYSEEDGPTLETTLVDQYVQKGAKKTFDVWAKDAEGKKIASSVTLDGKKVSYNWDDDAKTSYTLNFEGMEAGEHTVVVSASANDQTVTLTYTIIYEPAEKGELTGYAAFDIEATTISCGYIVEPVLVPIYEGENAAKALTDLIRENGYDYQITGSIESGFYLSRIVGSNAAGTSEATEPLILDAKLNPALESLVTGFNPDGGTEGALGEFDYTSGSGWMYCLNNIFPNVGFADSYLADEDVVRTQFTLALGKDIGDSYNGGAGAAEERADKDDLVYLVATVNSSENKETLLENASVRSAYDAANDTILKLDAAQEEVELATTNLQNVLTGEQPVSIRFTEESVEVPNTQSRQLQVVYEPESVEVPVHLTWTSSDPETVSVNKKGVVTAKKAGEAVITVSSGDLKASCTVTVPEVKLESISLNKEEMEMNTGASETLSVSYFPETTTGDRSLTWSSSDPSVVSVEDGTILALSEGEAVITVQAEDKTATCKVAVKTEEIPVESIETDETEISLQVGSTKKITAKAYPENTTEDTTLTLIPLNEDVVTVSSTATLKGVAEGTSGVVLKMGTKAILLQVTVKNIYAESFEFRDAPETLDLGKSKTIYLDFEPVASPADRNDVVWTVSDSEIASLGSTTGNSCKITGKKAGTVTITATLGEISRSFDLTIEERPLEGFTPPSEPVYITKLNSSTSVKFTEVPENTTYSGKYNYEIADPTIAKVSSASSYSPTAYVTGLKEGKTTLTISAADADVEKTVELIVENKVIPVTGISMENEEVYGNKGKSTNISLTLNPSDASYDKNKIVWTSSDPEVVSVSGKGTYASVQYLKKGTADITAVYDGTYKATCHVTVNEYPVKGVAFAEDSYTETSVGSRSTLNFTVQPENYTDTVEVSAVSDNENVATIYRSYASSSNSYVQVQPVNPGTATITVTLKVGEEKFEDTIEYTYAPLYVESLAFTKQEVKVQKGKSLYMYANTNYRYQPSAAKATTISWKSLDTSVATVSSTGTIKGVNYGETEVQAVLNNGTVVPLKVVVPMTCTGITLSASRLGLYKGDSVSLETLTVEPEGADIKDIAWTSGDESVAEIKNGRIYAVGEGTTDILAVSGSAAAACTVTVTQSEEEMKAVEVMDKIDAIGAVTLDSKEAIEAARAAYDALSSQEKAYVENEQVLLDAEAAYQKLADEHAAKEVKDLISAIGKVTLESKEAIEAARAAYDELSKSAQSFVTNLQTLIDAENAYDKLVGEEPIRQVEELINAIGEVTLESKEAIEAARAAYDDLSGADRKEVANAETLFDAEAAYQKLVDEQEAYEAFPEITTKVQAEVQDASTVKDSYEVIVSWEEVDYAKSYRIYRKEAGGSFQGLANAEAGTPSYVDETAEAGTTYYYTVKAFWEEDAQGISTKYPSDVKVEVPQNALDTPVVSTKSVNYCTIDVTWKKVTGAEKYVIYRKEAKVGTAFKSIATVSADTLKYRDGSAKMGVNYYYTCLLYTSPSPRDTR